MLTRPRLLPDELDRGYHGRAMRMNGKSHPKDLLDLVAVWAGVADRPRREVPAVELLAKLANLNLPHFVCQHTTLPLRRAITSYLPSLPHGDESNRSIVAYSAPRLARPGAYLCRDCVKEDLGFHGLSYWRREFQTPGLLWCPKHDSPLCYMEDEKAFLAPPSAYLDIAHEVEPNWAAAMKSSPTVQRFIDICAGLMERDRPLDVKDVSAVLRQPASARGFSLWARRSRTPLLSDAVLDEFDHPWLSLVFPAVLNKPREEVLSQLDGIFYLRNAASSVTAYVLAASILFKSADEALAALVQAPSEAPATAKPARPALERKTLVASYLEHDGSFSAVAKDLKKTRTTIGNKLTAIGLPNLTDRKGSGVVFLQNFMLKGMALEEARIQSGISRRAMEYILRTLGSSFLELIREMVPKPGARARKTRPLSPHEAKPT